MSANQILGIKAFCLKNKPTAILGVDWVIIIDLLICCFIFTWKQLLKNMISVMWMIALPPGPVDSVNLFEVSFYAEKTVFF